MNIIQLIKLGCSVQVIVEDSITGVITTYNESSSSLEMIYNNQNNRVTITIIDSVSYTTEDITANPVLYMDSGSGGVQITDFASFTSNYALVFDCTSGGGGGGGNQNLQQVTDVGNVTTNDIYVNSVYYWDSANLDYAHLQVIDRGWIFTDYDNVIRAIIQEGGISLRNSINGHQFSLNSTNLTSDKAFELPNFAGSNIPPRTIPISVNGYTADINGDIQIPSGSGQNLQQVLDTGNIASNGVGINSQLFLIDAGASQLQLEPYGLQITDLSNNDNLIFEFSNGGNLYTLFNGQQQGIDINYNTGVYKFGEFQNYFYLEFQNLQFGFKSNGLYLGLFSNGGFHRFGNIDNGFQTNLNIFDDGLIQSNSKIYFDLNGVGNTRFYIDEAYSFIGDVSGTKPLLILNNSATSGNIRTIANNNLYGLDLNFDTNLFTFGNTSTFNYLQVDDTNSNIWGYSNNLIVFLSGNAGISMSGNNTNIGDVDGRANLSVFGVDDANQTLYATNNMTQNTSGSSSGKHLKINISGTDYVIELKNP